MRFVGTKNGRKYRRRQGFTIIEISLVLVIIGLITGGVLAGQDLVHTATLHAEIRQLGEYQTATYAFRERYGYLPGDMPLAQARAVFPGMATTGAVYGTNGVGDGNGQIESVMIYATPTNLLCNWGTCVSGESVTYWYQLAQAGLIAEGNAKGSDPTITTYKGSDVLPPDKIQKGSRIAIASAGGQNYFIIGKY